MNRRNRRKSNAFTSLTQTQITNLREAFDILDCNNDKKVCKLDLESFSEKFHELTPEEIAQMLEELDEPTYISLLTFFAEKLGMMDEEIQIKADLCNLMEDGVLYESTLIDKLQIAEGDRKFLFNDTSRNGVVDLRRLVGLLKHGEVLENNLTVSEERIGDRPSSLL